MLQGSPCPLCFLNRVYTSVQLMAVYYKFKSAKDYDSVQFEGHFISVANLKEKIFEQTKLTRAINVDLLMSNAQTNAEYSDEGYLVPRNTSVLVRRVPGRHRAPVVAEVKQEKKPGGNIDHVAHFQNISKVVDTPQNVMPQDTNDLDDFGVDLFAPHQAAQSNQLPAIPDDENTRIKAFVDSSASEWQKQTQESLASGRGYGRGLQARGHGGRGSGRVFEKKTPPHGYVCHRCGVTGHYIQHCPTNGDPVYDMKKVKPPTGIPKTMLVANPDGSYALPTGEVAVLRPNEAIFEKEVTGMLQKRSMLENIPSELCCPLCRGVLKEAVLTSKCCFKSYCDKCIRNEIITKGRCVCGATNVLADDLLPNRTLRDAIDHFLESQMQTTMTTSSGNNAGSRLQVEGLPYRSDIEHWSTSLHRRSQTGFHLSPVGRHFADMESAPLPQQKPISPSVSGSRKDQLNDKLGEPKNPMQESSFPVDNVDGTPESQVTTREPIIQDDALSLQEASRVDEEVQQRRLKTAAIVSGTDIPRSQPKVSKVKAKRRRQLPSGDQHNFPPFRENGFEEELGGPGPSYSMQDERYCVNCGSYEHPAWDCPMRIMMGPEPYNYPPHMPGSDYYVQWGGMPHQRMMYPGYAGGFQGPYNAFGLALDTMPYNRGMGLEPYEANGFVNPYHGGYVEPTPIAGRPDGNIMSRQQFEARKAEMRRIREMQKYHERDLYCEGGHEVAESNGNKIHKHKYKRAPYDNVGEEEQHDQASVPSSSPSKNQRRTKYSEYNLDSDVALKRRGENRKRDKSRRLTAGEQR